MEFGRFALSLTGRQISSPQSPNRRPSIGIAEIMLSAKAIIGELLGHVFGG